MNNIFNLQWRRRVDQMVEALLRRHDLQYFLEGDYDNPSFRIKDSVVKRIAFSLCDKKEIKKADGTINLVPTSKEEISYYEWELRRQVQKRVATILKERWA